MRRTGKTAMAKNHLEKMRRLGYVLPNTDRMPNYKTAADFVKHRHNILKSRMIRKSLMDEHQARSHS